MKLKNQLAADQEKTIAILKESEYGSPICQFSQSFVI
jgi:hypothetical protein